jgi:hypothetical protein
MLAALMQAFPSDWRGVLLWNGIVVTDSGILGVHRREVCKPGDCIGHIRPRVIIKISEYTPPRKPRCFALRFNGR